MIYMNDSTIDWAHIQNQALSVEQLDSTSYNQVTGKEMKAWFQGGEMRKVDVIGSVRLVYYPMESDSTLIGMNVSETSLLNMFLENRKMKNDYESEIERYSLSYAPTSAGEDEVG